MSEFSVTFPFTVIDTGLSEYTKSAPYSVVGFKEINGVFTIIPENILLEPEQADLITYIKRYDETIQTQLLVSGLTEEKLLSILSYYQSESAKFAAENSVLMNGLGYTVEQKIAFVSKAVAEFEPIKKHVEMFSYYVIWDMFDAIVRDEILTEERISELKAGLYAKVFE